MSTPNSEQRRQEAINRLNLLREGVEPGVYTCGVTLFEVTRIIRRDNVLTYLFLIPQIGEDIPITSIADQEQALTAIIQEGVRVL